MRRALAVVVLALAAMGEAQAHGLAPTADDAPAHASLQLLRALLPSARAASRVRIDAAAGYRFISSDGLPDHATGTFPNRGNPHRIEAQRYEFRVPAAPAAAGRITALHRAGLFGVAINGVPFDPFTAEFWNNDPRWNYEALGGAMALGIDANNAHVQPNGAYHYHGIPRGILERFAQHAQPVLVGYAADGFPIYGPSGYSDPATPQGPLVELRASYRLKPGTRPGGPGGRHDGTFVADYEFVPKLGDLDECNGRTGITPEYPGGVYYYVITAGYPFVPRCFVGTPDATFQKGPPGRPPPMSHDPMRRGPPGPGHPPPGGPPGPPPFPPPGR